MGLQEGIWDSATALQLSVQITPLDLEASLPLNYLVGGAEGVASTEFCTKKKNRSWGTSDKKHKLLQIVGAAASDT